MAAVISLKLVEQQCSKDSVEDVARAKPLLLTLLEQLVSLGCS